MDKYAKLLDACGLFVKLAQELERSDIQAKLRKQRDELERARVKRQNEEREQLILKLKEKRKEEQKKQRAAAIKAVEEKKHPSVIKRKPSETPSEKPAPKSKPKEPEAYTLTKSDPISTVPYSVDTHSMERMKQRLEEMPSEQPVPDLEPNLVFALTTDRALAVILGEPGAAFPGSKIRILNNRGMFAQTIAKPDGSFNTNVPGVLGDEVVVQAITSGGSSEPLRLRVETKKWMERRKRETSETNRQKDLIRMMEEGRIPGRYFPSGTPEVWESPKKYRPLLGGLPDEPEEMGEKIASRINALLKFV